MIKIVCIDFQYLFVYFLANGLPVSGKDETILYIYEVSKVHFFNNGGEKKAVTQEVAKVTGSCQLFFAFSICRCLWLATGNLVGLFLKPTVLY